MKKTKKQLEKFTKEEIINVLISNKDFFKTSFLIEMLKKIKKNKLYDKYEDALILVYESEEEYSSYRKSLLLKYGKTYFNCLRKNEKEKLCLLSDKKNKYEKEVKEIINSIDLIEKQED